MNLQQRQFKNKRKKKTYNKSLQDFFNRAPDKVKQLAKKGVRAGYLDHSSFRSFMYECMRLDFNREVAEAIIKHYSGGMTC